MFEGKTAVVTGGSSGIGLAAARRLAAQGAHVFITGRRRAELDAAAKEIGSATAVPGDIGEPDDLDRLYRAVRDRGEGLDVLFANAGTAVFATLEETRAEDVDQTFAVNVRGTLLTVQKALPLFNEKASVIVNSSVRAYDGRETFGTYAASKAALRSYTRTWANELRGRGIRVNAVSPGSIDTPALALAVGEEKAAAAYAAFAAQVPMGRMGSADEVAALVAFLASDQSSFITGSDIFVDGGEMQF